MSRKKDTPNYTPKTGSGKMTEEFRRNMVHLYYDGKAVDEITQQYGVPRSTFYRWLKKYSRSETKPDAITTAKVKAMMETISALEEENKLLRKAIAILSK